MLSQILTLLLQVAASLLGGACLMRFYMQYQRIPFQNPLGRFVMALTDWLILPLRKIIARGRIDISSLVAAYLISLAHLSILWAMFGRGGYGTVAVDAIFGVGFMAIWGLIVLLIIYCILSWVRAESLAADIIDAMCAPLLRPFRRVIPLVGGVDLSALALLVLLQIALILLRGLREAVLF